MKREESNLGEAIKRVRLRVSIPHVTPNRLFWNTAHRHNIEANMPLEGPPDGQDRATTDLG